LEDAAQEAGAAHIYKSYYSMTLGLLRKEGSELIEKGRILKVSTLSAVELTSSAAVENKQEMIILIGNMLLDRFIVRALASAMNTRPLGVPL
jgi:hypothetical protein